MFDEVPHMCFAIGALDGKAATPLNARIRAVQSSRQKIESLTTQKFFGATLA
jgi:hypothetical protein